MENLLEETKRVLNCHGKTAEDILVITDGCNYYYWPQFEKQAKNFYYDSGYGIQEVNRNLKVVGDNWWLERWEYDGSEGWVFEKRPTIAGKSRVQELQLKEEW